ncbi:hypothetical protein EDC64_101553 [Aquabacter spiritensis]|uniref:Uncharacterized protein n=1 Tax=Aquabacter spiritensis TaxID=933073 RepID=A0A4R3M423_9HYPH|nr:hypothetical protein EDC64_101553 [Aquabacter spiritensis]
MSAALREPPPVAGIEDDAVSMPKGSRLGKSP